MVCGKLLVNFEFTHNRMLKAHIDLQYLNNYICYYYYNIKHVYLPFLVSSNPSSYSLSLSSHFWRSQFQKLLPPVTATTNRS